MRLQPEILKGQLHPPPGLFRIGPPATQHHEVIGVPYEHAEPLAPPLPHPVQHVEIDVREEGRYHPALRRARPRLLSSPLLQHPSLQPPPNQLEHAPIRDPPTHLRQQTGMVNAAKVVFDVDVHHVVVASVGRHANGLQRLRGAPFRPESIGHRQKVGLENWLNDELGRHLNHPVPYRRNAQRPLPPICLRNVSAPHRLRPILPGLEIALDAQQERLDPLLLDGDDRLAVHPRSPSIAPHPPPRFPQNVAPVDPVVQRVEAALPTPLGRPPQRPLEFSHFVLRVVGACAHALALTPMRTRDQSRGPSLQAVLLPPFLGTSTPSDSLPTPRRFGLALSTPPRSDVSCRVGPLQFHTGPWTRAAPHTPKESSAAPMMSRCLLPSPWHARLGLLGLSADNLTRRQDSRDVAARALAPSVEALDAPLGADDLASTLGP